MSCYHLRDIVGKANQPGSRREGFLEQAFVEQILQSQSQDRPLWNPEIDHSGFVVIAVWHHNPPTTHVHRI